MTSSSYNKSETPLFERRQVRDTIPDVVLERKDNVNQTKYPNNER